MAKRIGWRALTNGLASNEYVLTLAIDPRTPVTLYAGTSRGVFKSTDGGGMCEEVVRHAR